MLEWSATILQSSTYSAMVFPAALMLGIVGSVTSCCNLPVLGAIAGYSGMSDMTLIVVPPCGRAFFHGRNGRCLRRARGS